jgi:hypothetical protein
VTPKGGEEAALIAGRPLPHLRVDAAVQLLLQQGEPSGQSSRFYRGLPHTVTLLMYLWLKPEVGIVSLKCAGATFLKYQKILMLL